MRLRLLYHHAMRSCTRFMRGSCRRYNRFLLVLTAVYLGFVIERERISGSEERYPFASWSLFSKVPGVVDDHGLLLISINGRQLEPPVMFEESGRWFWAAGHHAAYCAILDFGSAVAQENEPEMERRRRLVERLYLGGGKASVEYQLVRRRWDPMQRWRGGDFIELEVLSSHRVARRGEEEQHEALATSGEDS